MSPSQDNTHTETLFNSGISVAIEISNYVRMCGYFALKSRYIDWLWTLQIIERRMEKKIRENKIAQKEIEIVKQQGFENFKKYLFMIRHKQKLDYITLDRVKIYLSEYEKVIIYWKDRFGYGMPEKQDHISSGWN